ncbi:MAG: DUF3168 domain-containing protein [Rhodobacter sp.]|nr:DUF3168 domain-containing protein [Rhodobacter sp.]
MADGVEVKLWKAVRAALIADATVSGFVGTRVHDRPPPEVTFPYVKAGEFEAGPWHDHDDRGHEIDFGIDLHTRPGARVGSTQAKNLGNAIMDVLDRNAAGLTVAGYQVYDILFLLSTPLDGGKNTDSGKRLVFRARLCTT